jgi:hypothetical protein
MMVAMLWKNMEIHLRLPLFQDLRQHKLSIQQLSFLFHLYISREEIAYEFTEADVAAAQSPSLSLIVASNWAYFVYVNVWPLAATDWTNEADRLSSDCFVPT